MGWKGPARCNDVWNPTPAISLHQARNEIALLFIQARGTREAEGPFIGHCWSPTRTIPESQTRPAYNQLPIELEFIRQNEHMTETKATVPPEIEKLTSDFSTARAGQAHTRWTDGCMLQQSSHALSAAPAMGDGSCAARPTSRELSMTPPFSAI
jgi:hypothetical protein